MKKLLAIVLALVTIFSFVGCQKNDGAKKEEEVPTLVWYVPIAKQNDLSLIMEKANEIIVPAIGAKLDMKLIDPGAFTERMTMNMAAKANFDICYSGYVNGYEAGVQRGGFLQLDELLKTATPNLYNSIDKTFWDELKKFDGKIYGVPNIQVTGTPYGYAIQKEYAEKYNLDLNSIKSPNDLEPFLEKIKQNEPDVYAYRTAQGEMPWWYFKNASLPGSLMYKTDDPNIKVESKFDNEDFKEGVKKLREWFKKGYIRPDVASAGDETSDFNRGKYVVTPLQYKPGTEANMKAKTNKDWVVAIMYDKGVVSELVGNNTAISATTKYPEKALKLIELVNTNKELYNLICFGLEGQHYKLDAENKVEFANNSGWAPKMDWVFGNQFNALVTKGQPADVWEKTKEQNKNCLMSPLLGFVQDISDMKSEISQVNSVNDEFVGAFANGSREPSEYMDEFRKKMEVSGQTKILEETQKQINKFIKK